MAIATLHWQDTPPPTCRGGSLTIGNFDGVHLGHASLLEALRSQAQVVGGPAVAVTLDPHPVQLLRPDRAPPLLTTAADRAELLQAAGADHVLILQTTPDLLQLTAEQFFQQVVCQRLEARALVEGVNFGFGRNREGNIDTLTALCQGAGLGLVVLPPLQLDGIVVSSSAVRAALEGGEVGQAARLLGRPYRLRGRVVGGQRRGQKLGFPTANLAEAATLIPGDGVYATRAWWQGRTWPAAANIGPNPTFGENARKLEVHLIGFDGDLYGHELAVDFVERLRDTRPFAGVGELVEQLRRDVDEARRLAGAGDAER
jgi:riboflavin kinase/FMN adenylyltransferase